MANKMVLFPSPLGAAFTGPSLPAFLPKPIAPPKFDRVTVRFLCPVKANDGRAFTHDDFAWVESRVRALTGGCSLEGVTDGSWDDDGVTYRDESRRYLAAVPESGLNDFYVFLAEVRARFEQITLYVEQAGRVAIY